MNQFRKGIVLDLFHWNRNNYLTGHQSKGNQEKGKKEKNNNIFFVSIDFSVGQCFSIIAKL